MSRPSRARTIFRYCRACKAADDAMFYILANYAVSGREAGQHPVVKRYRAQARALWHNLPPTIRAAVLPEGD